MKLILFIFGCCFFTVLYGQSPVSQPQKFQYNEIEQPGRFTSRDVQNQVSYWQEAVNLQAANGNAWLNYYIWASRDKTHSKAYIQLQLEEIARKAEKAIAGQREYFLMRYLLSLTQDVNNSSTRNVQHKPDSSSLMKALELSGDKKSIYPYLVQYHIISGNREELLKYCNLLEAIAPLDPVLKSYHRNVLASADSNAVIYARGMNDLVPLAMMQQLEGFRSDVTLAYYNGYAPIGVDTYLCLSNGKDEIKQYPDAGYAGLLVLTGAGLPVTAIKKIYEQQLSLSYIEGLTHLDETAMMLHKNYIPGLLLLYRIYNAEGNSRKAYIFGLLQKIGKLTGETGRIGQLINR